jgi:hypothetical protein
MVSGDSTKILTPMENNGGVSVGRKVQTVVCHYDDIHNFTFVVYYRKTFLLAPPRTCHMDRRQRQMSTGR